MRGASASGPREPLGPSAEVYASSAGRDIGRHLPPDPLREAVVADVRRFATGLGRPTPAGDARLHAVTTDLARNLEGEALPPFEVVDHLLGHYGLIEASPHFLLIRGSGGADEAIRAQISSQLGAIFKASAVAAVGVGVSRAGAEMAVVVALQERNIELADPVPRVMRAGASTRLAARIADRFRRPELIITAPSGSTHEVPLVQTRGRFSGEIRCDQGPGRYQVEVTGEDRGGPTVIANFPVFCGVTPPRTLPAVAATRSAPVPTAEAEARIFALINRDRRAAGLAPLAIDRQLTEIARAHSRDMADHDFIGHVSPTTGNAADRVKRAGAQPELLLENVGQAYTPDELHKSLMTSPGHRSNVLNPQVKRVGIGVAHGKSAPGTHPLLVTQLFAS